MVALFKYSRVGKMLSTIVASLLVEVSAVGIVCAVFLVLFIVAGIRQMYKLKD